MPALEMTLKSGTGQACAACKHQRRRCNPDCILAPFFPADQPRVFQNVHRLFGVKHVQNLLKKLGPHEKAMAVESIKFHAAMREKHPVYGCLVEIRSLSYQIQLAEEELQFLLHQLAQYRQLNRSTNDYPLQARLGVGPPGDGGMPLVHDDDDPPQLVTPMRPSYFIAENGDCTNRNLNEKENNDVDSLFIQQSCNYDSMSNANSGIVQSQTTTMNMNMNMTIPVPQEEMHSFFDNIEDTQSYIGCKEVYESCLESPFKDSKHSTELIVENELKSAAACFSLTSVH